MPLSDQLATLYDEMYFLHCLGPHAYTHEEPWLTFFNVVATRIQDDIAPKSVMDVGCAIGLLVGQLRFMGIDAWGFDVSEYALSQVPLEYADYCRLGSAAEPSSYGEVELITCIEVAEHMLPQDADYAIGLMCRYAQRAVLFSSSPDDYDEPTHINVRPVYYWAQQFARYGWYHDLDFDASFVSHWAMLFRPATLERHQLVMGYEREVWRLRQQNIAQRGIILSQKESQS